MTCHVVRASARLACCLLDMNGDRGRIDGTLGVSLSSPYVEVSAESAAALAIKGDANYKEAVASGLSLAESVSGNPVHVRLQIREAIGPHVGLGHKTQMTLAVAAASLRAMGRTIPLEDLVRQSGRGGTSGAGVHTFLGGGVVLDGGHRFAPGAKESFRPSSMATGILPPPLLARIFPPAHLRVVVGVPAELRGASGSAELAYFRSTFPLPRADTDALIANVLMRLVPALAEGDLDQIDNGVREVQDSRFKAGIWRAQPKAIQLVRGALNRRGLAVGLSSMGPSIYTFCHVATADEVADSFRSTFDGFGVVASVHVASVAANGARVWEE